MDKELVPRNPELKDHTSRCPRSRTRPQKEVERSVERHNSNTRVLLRLCAAPDPSVPGLDDLAVSPEEGPADPGRKREVPGRSKRSIFSTHLSYSCQGNAVSLAAQKRMR